MPQSSRQPRRLTRCRTGCMRCRIRRRKCDEGKPSCRNCVDRGFNCQYGPQLTFLTKNAHTIQASEAGSSSGKYDTIRFVNEEPQKDDERELSKEGSLSPQEGFQQPSHERERLPSEQLNTPRQPLNVELPGWGAQDSSSRGLSQTQAPTSSFSDKDESAVAGLLALGTSTNETIAPSMGFSEFAISSPNKDRSMNQVTTPARYNDLSMPFSPGQIPTASPLNMAISSTQTLELLRHYRYEVAPWLDICDLGQLFGIQGLQLAMVSQPAWFSVLALSEVSMNVLRSLSPLVITDKIPGAPATPEAQLDITTLAFLRAMDESKNCIMNFRAAWTQRAYDRELLRAFEPNIGHRNLESAIYWLFVRLDLAASLATDTDIQVPLLPTLPFLTSRELRIEDPFEDVFCFAHRPLWLCARAMQFIHNEEISPQTPPLHLWMQLMEELERWYQERPQGFQPMMEISIDGRSIETKQGFPVVLFAHGSGVFSNQLYHTAMLLLLHNRPRTARTSDFPSSAMSPLLHAQRICSIALNNERRECWDPVLLASFLTAARRMTHESQQQEILRGFERIRRVTGWDASDFLHDLQEEWGLLDS